MYSTVAESEEILQQIKEKYLPKIESCSVKIMIQNTGIDGDEATDDEKAFAEKYGFVCVDMDLVNEGTTIKAPLFEVMKYINSCETDEALGSDDD